MLRRKPRGALEESVAKIMQTTFRSWSTHRLNDNKWFGLGWLGLGAQGAQVLRGLDEGVLVAVSAGELGRHEGQHHLLVDEIGPRVWAPLRSCRKVIPASMADHVVRYTRCIWIFLSAAIRLNPRAAETNCLPLVELSFMVITLQCRPCLLSPARSRLIV